MVKKVFLLNKKIPAAAGIPKQISPVSRVWKTASGRIPVKNCI